MATAARVTITDDYPRYVVNIDGKPYIICDNIIDASNCEATLKRQDVCLPDVVTKVCGRCGLPIMITAWTGTPCSRCREKI